jgi:hypothetical protein
VRDRGLCRGGLMGVSKLVETVVWWGVVVIELCVLWDCGALFIWSLLIW